MTSLFEATGEGGGRARVEVRIQGTVRPQPSWHAAISGMRMSSRGWRCYWKRASTPVCPGLGNADMMTLHAGAIHRNGRKVSL